jgi:hypothetical protein
MDLCVEHGEEMSTMARRMLMTIFSANAVVAVMGASPALITQAAAGRPQEAVSADGKGRERDE